ncbi:hypothetical protein BDW59DRAFT_84104 [Aspergillus cavernicola]|uniref:NAD(P)-binding domain-containing protein n=1 Tax=Aspergillus cavernicola TaxID=176166 RepID=A0ABR4IA75_9EURO
MASSSDIVPPGGLVLVTVVTGVTGFIGSYVASGLLGLGYRVRGTVRSSDKAAWVTQAMTERHPSADFEAVVLPDQNATGAWDAILKDVDGIAQLASILMFVQQNFMGPREIENAIIFLDSTSAYSVQVSQLLLYFWAIL